jgi:hypothetical protein
MFVALQSNAQTLIKSSTLVEGFAISTSHDFTTFTTLEEGIIDQTIWWRKRYNRDHMEKTVYNFQSIFKRNSIIGARLYGIDIDLMAENFEKPKANTFRYWNKLRLGFDLIVSGDLNIKPYPLEEFYGYLDGEMYIRFLHLPHSARGDNRTKYRKGSVEIFCLVTPYQRVNGYFKFKPIGSTWLKFYYRQENKFAPAHVGILAEVETNPKGYGHVLVGSSKDSYRGITLCGGPDFNFKTNEISLYLGIKLDLRNH